MTDRACLPEPPCDWLMVTFWPVLAAQAFANAAFTSSYSSRVGSYETLRRVTDAGAARRDEERKEDKEISAKERKMALAPIARTRWRRERVERGTKAKRCISGPFLRNLILVTIRV